MTNKYKKYVLAVAGAMVIGSVSLTSQAQTAALETASSSQNETREERHENRRQFMEQWQSLKTEEKAEIYALFEQRIKADNTVLDKLAELGIIDSGKADQIKQHRQERFEKQKENGEFPIMHRPSRSREAHEAREGS